VRIIDDIQVKQNVYITARERGKIVARREGHNIFLNTGREWLAALISYASFAPDVFENVDRVRYMGFGIGGFRQLALPTANSSPIGGVSDAYRASYSQAGANNQTDTDPDVVQVERPVRVTGGTNDYPTNTGDRWVEQIQAPPEHNPASTSTFRRLFGQQEINYSPYISVPLSEIGLFTSAANPEFAFNPPVAYDTFDTLSKTAAFELEVIWTLSF